MIQYFRLERARLERTRVAEQTKGVGRPKVGGEFHLTDMFGKKVDDGTYRGRYVLVSSSKLKTKGVGLVINDAWGCGGVGLFWVHALPGYLPRGAG